MQDLLGWVSAGENAWMLQVFGVVFATVVINFFLRKVLRRLTIHAARTPNLWDDPLLDAAKRPALLASWVIGLSIAAEIIAAVTENELFAYGTTIRRIAIIALLVMFLVKFIRNCEERFIERSRRKEVDTDITTICVVGRLLRVSVMITGALVALQTLGISVSGVVAFGGIGGIAVGFAAKDLLANFFGGLMIYLDRPFSVGDWIRSPDRNIEGTVEDIGWRLTCIRTFDKRPLYIPNSIFTTISVENPSRMTNRRIKEVFGLRYCDAGKMRTIVSEVRAMLRAHPEIDTDQTLIVNFDAMSASSLDFFIYTFTKTTEWIRYHEIKEDVLLKVIDIVHANDADIAFPTRTLDGLDPLRALAAREEPDSSTRTDSPA